MAQTPEGALKVAAQKAGMELSAYLGRLAAGERRCTKCKQWKPRLEFGNDRSRYDGCARRCLQCVRVKVRVCTKGRQSAFKGRSHTAEARAAMGAAKKGMRLRLGIQHTPETKAKISAIVRARAVRGPEHPSYIDGRSLERHGLRASAEAKRWRYDVMSRDGFMCRHCGDDRGGNLNAHHIRPFATHPELRFETRNGITLCIPCHWLVHRYRLQLWSPCQ